MNVSVQEAETTAFVRDEELWFPDGNVVLEAQGRAFRVYQGLLAHHSEIFRDLFTVPQPTTTEMYEECPIVHLTGQPEDLRQLLRVIYHGNRYYPADEQLEFAIVAALVRMSHKYAIEHIRDSYLSRMKSCFCEDLDDFRNFRSQSGSPSMKLCVTATDAIAAVNIARLTETLSMLPSALFFCCLLKTETLINGHPRADGTLDCLSPADVIKCIDARLCLYQKANSTHSAIFDPTTSPPLCLQPTQCRKSIDTVHTWLLDVLHPTQALANLLTEKHLLMNDAPRKIWAELPQFLAIERPPGWPSE